VEREKKVSGRREETRGKEQLNNNTILETRQTRKPEPRKRAPTSKEKRRSKTRTTPKTQQSKKRTKTKSTKKQETSQRDTKL
jgi:hypothetical protein